MSALCDPIYDITITCHECGMVFTDWSDDKMVIQRVIDEYEEHMSNTHEDNL